VNFHCPALDLQLIGDHYCGCYRLANKVNPAFHSFGVDK